MLYDFENTGIGMSASTWHATQAWKPDTVTNARFTLEERSELMADIHINCPYCGEQLTATPPTRRGDDIDCPACSRSFTIPKKSYAKPIAIGVVFVALISIVASTYLPSETETEDAVAADASASDAPEAKGPAPAQAAAPKPAPTKIVAPTKEPIDFVKFGMTESEVLGIMKRPKAEFGRGNSSYWTYEAWEITFTDGKVSEKIRRRAP
ncbi:MAG: hypothetical protein OSB41_00770 [Kiritimatiellae bacterium]|nr:hypothetical protein [Kiritimatiellia bacterium]